MRYKISIILLVFILSILGCTKIWDDHYKKQPETVNMNVWDAIKDRSELSHFVVFRDFRVFRGKKKFY